MTGSLTILIPAAGRSSRMRGEDKLLQDIDGKPLLRIVAERAVQVAPVRVVVAEDQENRRACLFGLDLDVVSVVSGGGMGHSLSAGVAGLVTGVMILPADMPDITAHDLARMAALWQAGAGPILRASDKDGTPGHPVIFPQSRLPEIGRLSGDKGAADILKAHARDVALFPIGPQACLDLDTPEAWANWRERHGRK